MATDEYPFASSHDLPRRVFDAFGAGRMFWGTDITRLYCTWRECVTMFVDRMLGETGLDADDFQSLDWETACHRIAIFDVLRRQHNAASLLVEHVPTGPNAMAQRELLLSIPLRNGFAPDVAVRSAATLDGEFTFGLDLLVKGLVEVRRRG